MLVSVTVPMASSTAFDVALSTMMLLTLPYDDLFNKGRDASGAVYMASHQCQHPVAVKTEPISQYDSQSQFIKNLGLEDETLQRDDHRHEGQVKVEESNTPWFDLEGPLVLADFGGLSSAKVASFEDYQNEIRIRNVMGL